MPHKYLPLFSAVLGMGLLAWLAHVNTIPNPPLSQAQLAVLYLGIGCLIWGMAGGWSAIRDLAQDWRGRSRYEYLALAGILGLALVVRLWRLEDSVRILVDELNPINEILQLWDVPDLAILQPMPPYSPFPRLFASWQAGAADLLGHNLLALRLPSVLVGCLTVAVVYALGRVLFNAKTALAAALLMATFPPHMHFSRIGTLNIADPLFGALAIVFIAWALRSNQRAAWVLGGAALGLTQYFHEGGRLLFPGLVIVWMALKLVRRPQRLQVWKQGLLLGGITTAVIAAPVYYTLAHLNEPAAVRMSQNMLDGRYWYAILTSSPGSDLFNWLVRHVVEPFLLFVIQPDPSPFYGGEQPLILIVLLPAFFAGLVWSLRSSGGRLLLLWFVLTWLGNLLLADSALSSRYVVVLPAVVLLLAVGITETAADLRLTHRYRYAFAYVVVCGIIQVVYYFGPHLDVFNRQIRSGSRDAYDAILRAADLPPDTQIYLIQPPDTMTEMYAKTFLRYLADDLQIHFVEDARRLDWTALQGQRSAFFVPVSDTGSVGVLSAHVELAPPQHTPYQIPTESYVLYLPIN